MITLIIFILILGILIFVHEFGHFITAKKSGIRVEEFAFGFPPKIFSKKIGETEYSINALPLGGYVKIYGEENKEDSRDPRSFMAKPLRVRSLIVVAGITMNVILAFLIFSFGHIWGLPTIINGNHLAKIRNAQITILNVLEESPAEQIGIKRGDVIAGFQENGIEISVKEVEDVQNYIKEHSGKEISLIILRGKEKIIKTAIPRVNPPPNEGHLGIALAKTGIISYPWYLAPIKGFETTADLTIALAQGFYQIFKNLILTGKLGVEIAGPVGIAVLTYQTAQLGFIYLLQFVAILSLNLAIINILPFPALDGGKLLFLGIEKIKGSPIDRKYEQIIHMIGFVILIFLMILITFRDIRNFF